MSADDACSKRKVHATRSAIKKRRTAAAKLLKPLGDYMRCGGCQSIDHAHRTVDDAVEFLSTMTSETETTKHAEELHTQVMDDCYVIARRLDRPPFYLNDAECDSGPIHQISTLCDHMEIRWRWELKHPRAQGTFCSVVARVVAALLAIQVPGVVDTIVSYINVEEEISPPVANQMYCVYTQHMLRFLRERQTELRALDAQDDATRHLANHKRIAALFSIQVILENSGILQSDPRYGDSLQARAEVLEIDIHKLGNSLGCQHTVKHAREMRAARIELLE